MKKQNEKINAFTLGEVLLTLVMMGILMAITIPVLYNNVTNAGLAAQLKKTYGLLDQATTQIMMNNSGTLAGAFSSNVDMATKYCNILDCNKTCGTGTGCFSTDTYKNLDGSNYMSMDSRTDGSKVVLSDGTSIWFYSIGNCNSDHSFGVDTTSPLYNTCGEIMVDINGFKSPNQWGRDMFMFWITKTGIYPFGSYHDDTTCNCSTNGYSCAAKVLNEGAINY